MAGVIWFVQVVHYPLMARVGSSGFASYEALHSRLTTRVVILPMLLEVGTTLYMLWRPPGRVGVSWLWIGLMLLAVIWLSTFLLQVPAHRKLARGFDAEAHERLVRTNWIRTLAWTARIVVALLLVSGSRS